MTKYYQCPECGDVIRLGSEPRLCLACHLPPADPARLIPVEIVPVTQEPPSDPREKAIQEIVDDMGSWDVFGPNEENPMPAEDRRMYAEWAIEAYERATAAPTTPALPEGVRRANTSNDHDHRVWGITTLPGRFCLIDKAGNFVNGYEVTEQYILDCIERDMK